MRPLVVWALSMAAALVSTGVDAAVRATKMTHLVGTIVSAAAFGGAGFVIGSRSDLPLGRAVFVLAAGAVVYAGLTILLVVLAMGVKTGLPIGGIAAGFDVLLATACGYLGFSSGRRAKARRSE